MLKYTTTEVTFREIPDEVCLCINISNCPNHCPGCHSPELWEDIGEPLTKEVLLQLIKNNKGITCVCFMGGDSNIKELIELATLVRSKYGEDLAIAWYSGQNKIYNIFDYVKIGPYKKECGSLDVPTTNQKLFKSNFYDINDDRFWYWEDITYKFWKNDS